MMNPYMMGMGGMGMMNPMMGMGGMGMMNPYMMGMGGMGMMNPYMMGMGLGGYGMGMPMVHSTASHEDRKKQRKLSESVNNDLIDEQLAKDMIQEKKDAEKGGKLIPF